MPALERPSAISVSTSRSGGVGSSNGVADPLATDQPFDDVRVKDGFAGGDAARRVDQDLG
jgi:hypothetical protein